MRFPHRTRTAVLSALVAAALLLPSGAFAASGSPDSAPRPLGTTSPSISQISNTISAVEARIVSVRERLAEVDSRLPENAAEEVAATVRAFGAGFLPALADKTDALAADRRLKSELEAELTALFAERDELSRDAAQALAQAAAEAEAQAAAAEAARVAAEAEAARQRAEQAQEYGFFPVQGECDYSDTFGAPRSGGRSHKGTDVMAASGTPVVAVRAGTVTTSTSDLGGIQIYLRADDGTVYFYAHLESVAVTGPVAAGQVIGTVGSTGNASASAPHLHFEIQTPESVNPYPYLVKMVR